MTETTFVFPCDISDSEDDASSDDRENLVFERSAGHVRQHGGQKRKTPANGVGKKSASAAEDSKKNVHVQQAESNTQGDNVPSEHSNDKTAETVESLEMLREKRDSLFKRRSIVYQLMATSVIVMLHGISFLPYFWNNGLMNIRGLGEQTATQWAVLLGFALSCLYTPSMLYRVQMRWTMACGCTIAAVFSVARFYPSVWTLLPCGLLLGLSLGPFYASAGRHVARLACLYEGYQGAAYEQTVITFTAVFFACLSFSPLWISILHIVLFDLTPLIVDPGRLALPDYDCGFYYLWNFDDVYGKVNGLAPELHDALAGQLGSCLICTAAGVLLAITALQDIPFPKTGNALISREKVKDEVKEVTKQIRDANFVLLFPINLCLGFLETFCYTIFVQVQYCYLQVLYLFLK